MHNTVASKVTIEGTMLQLDDLRVLVEVIDRGSFSAAALRLGLSKQVVSRRMMGLEERLGTRLLVRTTRRMSPTAMGQQLLERGRRILADVDEAEQVARCGAAAPRGLLRVSAPVTFGTMHLSTIVPGFLVAHPAVELEIDLNDRAVDLVGEGYDMAIRVGPLADSTLIARKLGAMRMVACCSPDYARRKGMPDVPADLKVHECLVYGHANPQDWRFQIGKHVETIPVTGRMRANNGEMLCEAAVAGLGIVLLPSFIVGEALRAGTLVRMLDGFMQPMTGVYAMSPQHRQVSMMVRAFGDYVQECLAEVPGWDADGIV